jgi:hypothetical protein
MQKYIWSREYVLNTLQLGHTQATALAVSFAFPFAQKTLLVKFDFKYVGQAGHKHNLVFSSLSGTGLPKKITKYTFNL